MSMNARALAPRWRFTAEDYYRMAEVGILREDQRVELIEGEIVEMSPIGSRHADCVENLGTLLRGALESKPLKVRSQNPVHLSRFSDPQPDLAVVRAGSYRAAHPTPSDILLVIEVADSSLGYDRETKVPLYLRSGIPEVWLVDLENHAVDVHSPAGVRHFSHGEMVVSSALPDLTILVNDVIEG